MNPIVQAINVSHQYGTQHSVQNLSLSLETGEVMALLGTNGAGKTTTLKLLTGELIPLTGSIRINGVDINIHPCKAKHHLGYLPDVAPLYGDLSVDEFLLYCGRIRGMTTKDARTRLAEVKSFCELKSVGRRLISKLSKGYQQRVGIAQAIIHKPIVIILDEPTNGLDPTQMQEMRDLILHLRNQSGVILSTHQLNEVEQICDRVHMIKSGRTVFCEKIDDLQQSNRIRIRFVNTVPKESLEQLPEVNKVIKISDTQIEIIASAHPDELKSVLISQSQQHDWEIVEIYDIKETLENIFVSEVLRSHH